MHTDADERSRKTTSKNSCLRCSYRLGSGLWKRKFHSSMGDGRSQFISKREAAAPNSLRYAAKHSVGDATHKLDSSCPAEDARETMHISSRRGVPTANAAHSVSEAVCMVKQHYKRPPRPCYESTADIGTAGAAQYSASSKRGMEMSSTGTAQQADCNGSCKEMVFAAAKCTEACDTQQRIDGW